jgi:tRNA pseudouridine55 synthase
MDERVASYVDGGMILIDKPLGWTSFDAVNYIRNFFRRSLAVHKLKIGHAGTLDPLASGLLILCTGKSTKRIQEFQDMGKTYTCTMDFSGVTPSFDMETAVAEKFRYEHLNTDLIEEALQKFRGVISQVPPSFSAVKVDGKRAYELARKSRPLELSPRELIISRFELVRMELPLADFIISCSKGTYIRALARDLGLALGAGAYLRSLRRTEIGNLSVDEALTPHDFCSGLRPSD